METTSGTSMEELRDKVNSTLYTYEQVKLSPSMFLNYGGDGITSISFDGGDNWHFFSKEGLNYLGYRLSLGSAWAHKMAQYNPDCLLKTFSQTIAMEHMHQEVQFAKTNGVVYGILTNYVPEAHSNILDLVSDLSYQVASWTLSPISMRIRIANTYTWKPGEVKFGLSIDNGTAGQVAFGMMFSIFTAKGNEYVRSVSGYARERHLSLTNIALVRDSIDKAMVDAQEEEYSIWLCNHFVKYFEVDDMFSTNRPGKILMNKIDDFRSLTNKTAMEWLEFAIDELNSDLVKRFDDKFSKEFKIVRGV